MALPGAQPDHRRARPRQRGRGGTRAFGRAHHGGFRAVPGEITSALSAGTNDLLRQGAAPLIAARDVLAALGLEQEPPPRLQVSAPAGSVLELLADGARDADELARLAGRPSAEVAAVLVELELAGLVAEADGLYRVSPGRTPALREPA